MSCPRSSDGLARMTRVTHRPPPKLAHRPPRRRPARELASRLTPREIGRVFAERCGKVDLVLLLLAQDFADVLGDRILAERLALAYALAVRANRVVLVLP